MTEPRPLCKKCEDMIAEDDLTWVGNDPFHLSCVTTVDLEKRGMKILVAFLSEQGRKCTPSNVKRYDLKVDGKYAELKATTQSFFGLSESQYQGLKSGELQTVFIVNGDEVTEYDRADLIEAVPKPETTYYFYRSGLTPTASHTCNGFL